MNFLSSKVFHLKRRSELKKKTIIFLDVLAIVLTILILVPEAKKYKDMPLVMDETIHVDDSVVEGKLRAVNPLDYRYTYLGHVPIYRFIAVAWFKVFPGEPKYARAFSVVLSIITLFSVYILFFHLNSWFVGISSIFLLSATPIFYNYSYLVLADNFVCGLFVLAFYFAIREKNILTSIMFFILVMTRESGLAFAFSYASSYLIVYGVTVQNIKKTRNILAPGVVALGVFFLANKIKYNIFSRHPNASSSYIHGHIDAAYGFFELSPTKIETLYNLYSSTFSNSIFFGGLVLLAIVKVFKKNNLEKQTRMLILMSFFTIVQFTIFLFLYNDFVYKDAVIIVVMLLVVSIASITHLEPKKAPVIIIFMGMSSFILNIAFIRPSNEIIQTEFYKRVAWGLQENANNKTVCLPQFLNLARGKVHGLFRQPIQFKVSCKEDVEIASIYVWQPQPQKELMQKIIKERGYKLLFKEKQYGLYTEFYSN